MLEAIRYVDEVIPEKNWNQKPEDVLLHDIDVVVMGSDWEGNEKFEELRDLCDVIYLPRTKGISTTKIKKDLGIVNKKENTIGEKPKVKVNKIKVG